MDNTEAATEATEPSSTNSQQIEKCPVCLQLIDRSKSFTSVCFHSFCFECILQWSSIKLSCPLCKTAFDRILFNIKSQVQYKQFNVKPIIQPQSLNTGGDIIEYNLNDPIIAQESTNNSNKTVSKASWLVNNELAPVEFRILVYLNKWYCCPSQICYHLKITNLKEEFNITNINDLNRAKLFDELQASLKSDTLYLISFRRVRSFRNTKPEFYRQNQACTHRLIQFIYRELKAIACCMSSSKLTNDNRQYLNQVNRSKLIQLIITELKRNTINSELFLNLISEFISPIELCKHFIHELNVYCGSTSNSLVDYDSKCVYYSKMESANRNFDLELKTPNDLAPLPVNLCKYRLNVKPNIDLSTSTVGAAASTTTTTQNSPILLVSDDNESVSTPIYAYNYDDSNDTSISSERSSFCEYLEPEPKKTPDYILINSSSSSSESNAVSSKQKKKSRSRPKERTEAHCSKTYASTSRSRSESSSISKERHNYKNKLKHKKSKHKKHRKHIDRSSTPTAGTTSPGTSRSRSHDQQHRHHHKKKKKKRNKSKK